MNTEIANRVRQSLSSSKKVEAKVMAMTHISGVSSETDVNQGREVTTSRCWRGEEDGENWEAPLELGQEGITRSHEEVGKPKILLP
ncbi:hypothetical protein RYX36_013936 [Vicia faba]